MNGIGGGVRLRNAFTLLFSLSLLTGIGLTLASCGRGAPGGRSDKAAHAMYHCPMHPTYTSDRLGDCPICGMKLVLIDPAGHDSSVAGAAPEGPQHILYYRNPMDATVTSPVPMKDSMGMDYVPVYSGETGAQGGVEGLAVVELNADELQLTGIRTATAQEGELGDGLRTVGEVKADETRLRQVHTKVSGTIERLFVSFSGQQVRRGQPLLSLYSPELLATQEEYVRALESAGRFGESDVPEVRSGAQQVLEAARRRLELFDVPASVIEQLTRTRKVTRTITLNAPSSGFVSAKEVFEGMQVEPATTLFTVTDLSRVWVEAEVYENEAGNVRVGQAARITLSDEPGQARTARITYIYPFLDAASRTLRVRFELDNPGERLKPGMYANVELQGRSAEGVLIPDSAVMDTGVRQIVYVQTGDRRFEPRLVKVGARSGEQALILSGVAAGESVVVQANFLLDSESRLRAAIAGSAR